MAVLFIEIKQVQLGISANHITTRNSHVDIVFFLAG
jgi:hypothetical protein